MSQYNAPIKIKRLTGDITSLMNGLTIPEAIALLEGYQEKHGKKAQLFSEHIGYDGGVELLIVDKDFDLEKMEKDKKQLVKRISTLKNNIQEYKEESKTFANLSNQIKNAEKRLSEIDFYLTNLSV